MSISHGSPRVQPVGPQTAAGGGPTSQRMQPGSADELFRLLIDAVADYAIFALDTQGRVLTWNAGAQRIMGFAGEEIVGRHFSVFFPEEERASARPEQELAGAAAEGRYAEESWRVRKDGSRFPASVVVTAVRGAAGELLGFAKVTRDLTERQTAETQRVHDARRLAAAEAGRAAAERRSAGLGELLEQLQAQAAELHAKRAEAEAASRAKSDFLASMSHELRTPLNAMGGYLDLLLNGIRGEIPDIVRHDLERVRHSQQHLLVLINDLLSFVRVSGGRVEYDLTAVDVADLVREVRGMLAPQARAKGIALRTRGTPGLAVIADRERAGQILLNLLSNSLKFTSRGGRILIRCVHVGDMVRIHVRDNGRGISTNQLERIFEPFTQLEPTFTRTSDGLGLGLAISRDLAHGMGGNLSVRSKVGIGSTFTLTLPLA